VRHHRSGLRAKWPYLESGDSSNIRLEQLLDDLRQPVLIERDRGLRLLFARDVDEKMRIPIPSLGAAALLATSCLVCGGPQEPPQLPVVGVKHVALKIRVRKPRLAIILCKFLDKAAETRPRLDLPACEFADLMTVEYAARSPQQLIMIVKMLCALRGC